MRYLIVAGLISLFSYLAFAETSYEPLYAYEVSYSLDADAAMKSCERTARKTSSWGYWGDATGFTCDPFPTYRFKDYMKSTYFGLEPLFNNTNFDYAQYLYFGKSRGLGIFKVDQDEFLPFSFYKNRIYDFLNKVTSKPLSFVYVGTNSHDYYKENLIAKEKIDDVVLATRKHRKIDSEECRATWSIKNHLNYCTISLSSVARLNLGIQVKTILLKFRKEGNDYTWMFSGGMDKIYIGLYRKTRLKQPSYEFAYFEEDLKNAIEEFNTRLDELYIEAIVNKKDAEFNKYNILGKVVMAKKKFDFENFECNQTYEQYLDDEDGDWNENNISCKTRNGHKFISNKYIIKALGNKKKLRIQNADLYLDIQFNASKQEILLTTDIEYDQGVKAKDYSYEDYRDLIKQLLTSNPDLLDFQYISLE